MAARRVLVAVPAAGLLAAVLLGVPAAGRAATDPATRIGELRSQLGEASRAELDALKEVEAVRAQRARLDGAVASAEARLADANRKVAAAEAEIEQVAGRYLAVEAHIADTDGRLRVAEADLTRTAVERYRRADSGSAVLSLLRGVTEPGQVAAARRYLRDLSAEQRRTVQAVEDLRAELDVQRQQLAEERARAEAARAEAARQREAVAALQAETRQARAAAAAEESREQAVLASIRARKDEFTRELAVLQAASSSVTQLLRNLQAGQTPSGYGPLKAPVSAAVTSAFGPRVHPIFGDARLHTGVDFGAGQGAPIRAAGTGTVVFAGAMSGYGNVVIVDHGGTVATLYAHQSRVATSVGRRVATGDVIGAVGSTGYATGPHLHFEVRIQGVPVDPMPYL